MKAISTMPDISPSSLANFSKTINRPSITIVAVVLGLYLGIMRFPFLQYLKPVGDFYIALLQMCVLPFLLATIPLAVRSALTSGTAGKVVGRLAIWLVVTLVVVTLIAVLVPTVVFNLMPLDQATTNRIGILVGASADQVDLEFALNPLLSSEPSAIRGDGPPVCRTRQHFLCAFFKRQPARDYFCGHLWHRNGGERASLGNLHFQCP